MHYSISRPQAPQAANSSKGRGTRSLLAKQRQQQQQPDGSSVVSFVTQLRDYSREHQELVAELYQLAGREVPVQPKHETDAAPLGQQLAAVPAAAAGGGGPLSGVADADHSKPACEGHAAAVNGNAAAVVDAGTARHSSGGSSPAGSPTANGGAAECGADLDDSERPQKRVRQGSEPV